jgi:2-C-methyl-D-erythritol 2,4-cyclodiphosphate synthase
LRADKDEISFYAIFIFDFVGNIDCTLIAQAPKMAPYLLKMRENLASALKTDVENINIKATTEEKLGFTGRKEGISAHAVCIILKN